MTPVNYERDSIKLTSVLIILKKMEYNGTEKVGLATPAPEYFIDKHRVLAHIF